MEFVMILKMAFRNILLHKIRTSVFGFILTFGTLIAILGNSFVDAISNGMKSSITKSFVGDIQIYSKDAPESIALFGTPGGNIPDIGFVNHFKNVKNILLQNVPNIQTIVPMGTNIAMLNPGNLLDVKLTELRDLEKSKGSSAKIQSLILHIQSIIKRVREDFQRNPENL